MTGPTVNNPRKHVVAVRLNDAEKAQLDRDRGTRSPSDYLRLLLTDGAIITPFTYSGDGAVWLDRDDVAPAGNVSADGSTVLPPEEGS